ncbi:MAG: hypothetical protein AAFV43_13775 [Planctomycetota bacterium]
MHRWFNPPIERRAWLAPLAAFALPLTLLALTLPHFVNASSSMEDWTLLLVGGLIMQPLGAALWAVGATRPAVSRWPTAVAACVAQALVATLLMRGPARAVLMFLALFAVYAGTLAVWRWLRPWRLTIEDASSDPLAPSANRFGVKWLLGATVVVAALVTAARWTDGMSGAPLASKSWLAIGGEAVQFGLLYALMLSPALFALVAGLRRKPSVVRSIVGLLVAIPAAAVAATIGIFGLQPAAAWDSVLPQAAAIIAGATIASLVASLVLRWGGYRIVFAAITR